MDKRNSYKSFFAAYLFMLYGFIATPVQFWHQHQFLSSSSKAKTSDKSFVNIEQIGAVDSDCDICSHYYSIHNSDTVLLNPSFFGIWSLLQHSIYLEALPLSCANVGSRGPPTTML